ncbi:MAG TPA: NAD(P)-dependent alcohol dehydrogenase [Gemmatimonadaceae bacterium]|nr:NAD(P)-dependent alcohol dehydrogenase [Gemmatimonadaceae bacterium]
MRAVICTAYGPPEVLQLADVPRPVPKRNQIRIRIAATSVSFSDTLVRGMRVPRRLQIPFRLFAGWNAPRRKILGMVLAGDVESVGRSVTRFKAGDEVFGMSVWAVGTYAEEVCWPANAVLAPRPANLSYEEAAAIPYGGLLALHCLRKAGLQRGQRALIYGASGAIGTAAVQLAKYVGAHVTGVCSGANTALVASLGADAVLDYTREDFTRSGERYDLILDAVGRGKSAAAMLHAQSALVPGGKCISIDDDLPKGTQPNLELLKQLAESGALKPVIDRAYPMEEIAEAHRYADLGHKRGNLVVTIGARG